MTMCVYQHLSESYFSQPEGCTRGAHLSLPRGGRAWRTPPGGGLAALPRWKWVQESERASLTSYLFLISQKLGAQRISLSRDLGTGLTCGDTVDDRCHSLACSQGLRFRGFPYTFLRPSSDNAERLSERSGMETCRVAVGHFGGIKS